MTLHAPSQSAGQPERPTAIGHHHQTPAARRLPLGIVLFGPPGSGKGTVGKTIGKLPGLVHCSSGDLIRAAMSEKGARNDCWAPVASGSLIDDGILWQLFDAFLSSLVGSAPSDAPLPLVIIDGVPRCHLQVHELAKRVDVRGVFYLECPDPQVLLNRLARRSTLESRMDDASRTTIETRLRLFNEETLPLLGEYHPTVIVRFDASQAPAKVLADIFAALHSLQEDLTVFHKSDHMLVGNRRDARCLTQ